MFDEGKIAAIQEYLVQTLSDAVVTNQFDFERTAQVFSVNYPGSTHLIVVAKSAFQRYSSDQLVSLLEGAVDRLRHVQPQIEVRISDEGMVVQ